MRNIIILCSVIGIAILAATVGLMLRPERYGEPFTSDVVTPLASVLTEPDAYLDKPLLIEGIVSRQCALTGCFFFFAVGEQRLRIELSEVATSLPQRKGYRARVAGTLQRQSGSLMFSGKSVQFFRR